MAGTKLIAVIKFSIIALLITPWITAILGLQLPELWIAAGGLGFAQAILVQRNYLGAADYYRLRIRSRSPSTTPELEDARVGRLIEGLFLSSVFVFLLGCLGTLGVFGSASS